MSLKKLRQIIVILSFGLLCGGVGYWFGTHKIEIKEKKITVGKKEFSRPQVAIINKNAPVVKNLNFNLFWEVWQNLEDKYLEKEKIDREKMFYGAIKGLTASLEDPYTLFLTPEENKKAIDDLNGTFGGVGIELNLDKEGRIMVVAPLKGTPAEEAGIRAGDLILRIQDKNKGIDEETTGMSLTEAVEKIRGPENTEVILTILHEGESEPKPITLKRRIIIVPSVETDFLENETIAHLKLMRFGDLTADQWNKEVDKIVQKSSVKGLILDLRNNPGGYLMGAVNLASEFLEKGEIVRQENYKGEKESYGVVKKGRLLNLPMVVLINKGTASASEILAAALQEHQRAKIIGTVSFGKGTIQEAQELSLGAGLHITTAKWLTPKGNWLNGKGINPDFVVENDPNNPKDDKQLQKAIELIKEGKI